MPRGGPRIPGPGKSLGRPPATDPRTYTDYGYERIAVQKPTGNGSDKAAFDWFMSKSPLERLLLITHLHKSLPSE